MNLTKTEVYSIVDSELKSFLKDKEFEKKIREITSDVIEKFYKTLYNKRNFWKNELKNK
nr:MAG TPA: hypothetical protein [Caudoviricetes sp.]